MKKTLVLSAVLLLALLTPTLAAAGEWTGWITDAKCGAQGAKAEHADCAKKCHEGGEALVFYNTADEKLYKLDNQELAAKHIGHAVTVKGDLDGETIKVAAIEAPANHAHH